MSAADRVMLTFVDKLTRTPQAMREDDVAALRAHGFDDRSIHDTVLVAAYYAFVNRVADGLGVTLEPGWEAS
jgi:alkylhydroperoxidase family enzyme